MRSFVTSLALMAVAMLAFASSAVAAESKCINCHTKVTPGIVDQHVAGKMGQEGIDCSDCHGSDHNGPSNVEKVKIPTPDTCAECHEERAAEFNNGKHALAWVAATAMPMFSHQPNAVSGDGYKGCSGCHKIGAKTAEEAKEYRYGSAGCDACHTRHTFSVKEAKDPRACQTCHMGFDHPQWEMYSTSKHGTIWQIEGPDSTRAPTCQTCHMPDGDHAVMTAWGFLALRLPEADQEWMADRAVILQGLGILDDKGNPTPRLDVVKAGKVARLTKEDFDTERNKMVEVCEKCHSPSYVEKHFEASDQMVREADKLMAEAITIVKDLYKDGVLEVPKDWEYAPDILQFYDAETVIEQELYVMFLEFRQRTFQGAFHANPDYMHWYGWAEMKKSLATIKAEAKALRAEKGK